MVEFGHTEYDMLHTTKRRVDEIDKRINEGIKIEGEINTQITSLNYAVETLAQDIEELSKRLADLEEKERQRAQLEIKEEEVWTELNKEAQKIADDVFREEHMQEVAVDDYETGGC